jgi:serine/threonine-protein kinase ULK/ATG1
MAPEVIRGFAYDKKADVGSLGAVLYELLFGRCPFEENQSLSSQNIYLIYN